MNFFFSSRRRHTFFFQAEDGIRDRSPSRGLGDVYKRQSVMCTFQGQVGLWLTTNMVLCFPSHLLSLSCVACFYFCIPTCIFILIFNICDPYLSRSDRLLCPFATIRLTNRERVSNRSQHPIFDYLIIWLLGDCIFWPSYLQRYIIQSLYFTCCFFLGGRFLSLLFYPRLERHPF